MSSEKEEHASDDVPTVDKDALTGQPVMQVVNADLALALTTGKQLNALSWDAIKLYLVLVVAFMGSMSNGFDGQVMSAVNGMQYAFLFYIESVIE